MDFSSEGFFLRPEPAAKFHRGAPDAMVQPENLEQPRCGFLSGRSWIGQNAVLDLGKWCELM